MVVGGFDIAPDTLKSAIRFNATGAEFDAM